jgi:hypothetical protein
MKGTVFWDMTPCSLMNGVSFSEEPLGQKRVI